MPDNQIDNIPVLGNPYSDTADEGAAESKRRGRFVYQVPPTSFFDSTDPNVLPPKQYQNELGIDSEGNIGFYNKTANGYEFITKTKSLQNQVDNIIKSGILDTLSGINNNLEFYYGVLHNNILYPNSSLAFPPAYRYVGVSYNGNDILAGYINYTQTDTINGSSMINAINGRVPLKKILEASDSYLTLNALQLTTNQITDGDIVTLSFYSDTVVGSPVIAIKQMQVRVSKGTVDVAGSVKETVLGLRLTNVSNGTIINYLDQSQGVVFTEGTNLENVKFTGLVYTLAAGSTVPTYYYRELVPTWPDSDNPGEVPNKGNITLSYIDSNGQPIASMTVIATFTKIYNYDTVMAVAFKQDNSSSADNNVDIRYVVFGSSGGSDLVNITHNVYIEKKDGQPGIVDDSPSVDPNTFTSYRHAVLETMTSHSTTSFGYNIKSSIVKISESFSGRNTIISPYDESTSKRPYVDNSYYMVGADPNNAQDYNYQFIKATVAVDNGNKLRLTYADENTNFKWLYNNSSDTNKLGQGIMAFLTGVFGASGSNYDINDSVKFNIQGTTTTEEKIYLTDDEWSSGILTISGIFNSGSTTIGKTTTGDISFTKVVSDGQGQALSSNDINNFHLEDGYRTAILKVYHGKSEDSLRCKAIYKLKIDTI